MLEKSRPKGDDFESDDDADSLDAHLDAEDGIDSDTDADEEGGIRQNAKPRKRKVKKMLVEGNKVVIGNSHQARMMFDPKGAAITNPFEAGNSMIKKAIVKEKKEHDRKELDGKCKLADNCFQQCMSDRSCVASSVDDAPDCFLLEEHSPAMRYYLSSICYGSRRTN